MKNEDLCMKKVENYCTCYETKQNLDLLDYRKKCRAQVKIEKAEHHFQEIPKFPTVRDMYKWSQTNHPCPQLMPTALKQSRTEPPRDWCPTPLFPDL